MLIQEFLQLSSFFLSIALCSKWFWAYTSSSQIIPSTQVDRLLDETVPLLPTTTLNSSISLFSKHIRLLFISDIFAILLSIMSIHEILTFFQKELPSHSFPIGQLALCFNYILLIAVSRFMSSEYRFFQLSSIIDHNRKDRFCSTIDILVQYICFIWFFNSSLVITLYFVYPMDILCLLSIIKVSCYSITLILFPILRLRLYKTPTLSTITEPNISAWKDARKNIRYLASSLWPNTVYLQLMVFGCIIILILGRVVNVLVPTQYKIVIDSLSTEASSNVAEKKPYFAWGSILVFIFLRSLQGGVGLLSTIQSLMWIPVGQFSTKEVHIQCITFTWTFFTVSFEKKGEILRVMDRGTASMSALLSYILFNILPVFIDIGLAVFYFVIVFDLIFGMIVFFTMALYITFTIWITEWRTKFRREVNELDNACEAASVDSLLNFETVKYYGNEGYEVQRYSKAIDAYQKADWKNNATLNVLNIAQNMTISVGMLSGCLLCAYDVVQGTRTVGEFVLFMTYILQLYQPLNWFGTYYRVIQKNFIDMEQMMRLFKEIPEIQDKPNAKDLVISEGGKVEFENVTFAYDIRNTVLKNISFTVLPGQTIAFVGPSGGGKSSIFRLLFRFYEIQSGSIRIDDQDIHQITQKSLRSQMGVVPQDTVLFNNTIMYNINYGKIDATEQEVIEAAKASHIHDKILSFPEGYNTMVGERGLRLSGGEKQRVAIARTLLKDPAIILLDEATSALDNSTERHIQATLETLYSSTKLKKRTKLVIAHRLSTIMNADLILVIKNGEIVERGRHSELIQYGIKAGIQIDKEPASLGTYYWMWMSQLEKEKEKNVVNV